jgi:hypothetical protein
MTDDEMALAYYRAAFQDERPEFVPDFVEILRTVRSDLPFSGSFVHPGIARAVCNQWGAVAVRASDGKLLGLKPAEFEVKSWRPAETRP